MIFTLSEITLTWCAWLPPHNPVHLEFIPLVFPILKLRSLSTMTSTYLDHTQPSHRNIHQLLLLNQMLQSPMKALENGFVVTYHDNKILMDINNPTKNSSLCPEPRIPKKTGIPKNMTQSPQPTNSLMRKNSGDAFDFTPPLSNDLLQVLRSFQTIHRSQ